MEWQGGGSIARAGRGGGGERSYASQRMENNDINRHPGNGERKKPMVGQRKLKGGRTTIQNDGTLQQPITKRRKKPNLQKCQKLKKGKEGKKDKVVGGLRPKKINPRVRIRKKGQLAGRGQKSLSEVENSIKTKTS